MKNHKKNCQNIFAKTMTKRTQNKSARKIGNESRSCCFLLHSLVLQTSCRAVKNLARKIIVKSLPHISSFKLFMSTYVTSEDEHFRGDVDALLKVMKLAFNDIEQKKFIFALRDCPVNERQVFTNFLKVKPDSSLKRKILDGSRQFFFVHLLWQELFAAMKLMLFADENQFKKYFWICQGGI